jgi:hypothetical protein
MTSRSRKALGERARLGLSGSQRTGLASHADGRISTWNSEVIRRRRMSGITPGWPLTAGLTERVLASALRVP